LGARSWGRNVDGDLHGRTVPRRPRHERKFNHGKNDEGKLLYCSFCGKSQHEVRKLIAGPSVFICDECVELCNDIIREEMQEGMGEATSRCPSRARSTRVSIST
jgi:hypothetical protein